MTQNRKAEIQRKLSLARVPEPPAGLEERIKADIPRHLLEPQRERARLQRWMSISLRAAAAVLLLVTSTVALVQLFSETDPATMATSAPPAMIERRGHTAGATSFAPAAPVQTTAMPVGDASAEGAQIQLAEMDQPARAIIPTSRQRAARFDTIAASPVAPPPPSVIPQALVSPVVADSSIAEEVSATRSLGAAANSITPPTEAAPAAPAAAGVMMRATEPAALAEPQQRQDRSSPPQPDQLFGISADPDAFGRIKRAIEAGERPSSADVDVEALINYFAGAAKRQRQDVTLDVEGSPAPVSNGTSTIILRFTIDTARAALDGTAQAAARDAKIEIELDGDAIASYRRVGGRERTSAEELTLQKNVSITGLYEVELKPRLRWRQRIATVRLRYRLTHGGREQVIERTIRAGNITPTWMAATARHRLASLGAVWGESLQHAARATEVARKAEELAVKEPNDERAKELAEAASASSRL